MLHHSVHMQAKFLHHRELLRVSGLFLMLLETLLLLYVSLTYVDACLVWLYVLIQCGLFVCVSTQQTTIIQCLHILYTAMFVLVPVLATSQYLYALHMVVIIITFGLRSDCSGECPINTMEHDSKKIYNEDLVDKINFNVFFASSGFFTLIKWLSLHP